MLSQQQRNTSNKACSGTTAPATPKKGSVEQQRLTSELSNSSDDSDMISVKKNIQLPAGGDNNRVAVAGGGALNVNNNYLYEANCRRPSAGMVKVKLASASQQWDNKAEVEVDCDNPDEVVDKMLQSIVDKFPPSSAVTLEKGQQHTHAGGLHQHTSQIPSIAYMGGGGPPPAVYPQYPQHPQARYTRELPKVVPASAGSMHNSMLRDPRAHLRDASKGRGGTPKSVTNSSMYTSKLSSQHMPSAHYMQMQPMSRMDKKMKNSSTNSSLVSTQHMIDRSVFQGGNIISIDQSTLIHEVPRFVPKVEVKEIVKEVPKFEVEWAEKIVEIPQIQYVDKIEEIPQMVETVRHVTKFETVDVPKEVTKYVPKVEIKVVEKIIEVSKTEIPVCVANAVDTAYVVPRFADRNVPVIMNQCVVPEIEETGATLEVEVNKYEPFLVPVDVYVPVPVTVPITKRNDPVTREQFPSSSCDPHLLQHLMIEMNPHLQHLELFNFQQHELFESLIQKSHQQAAQHCLQPPQPVINPVLTLENTCSKSLTGAPATPTQTAGDDTSNTLANRSTTYQRKNSRISRGSSGNTSCRKPSQPSRHATHAGSAASAQQRHYSQRPNGQCVIPPTAMIPPTTSYSSGSYLCSDPNMSLPGGAAYAPRTFHSSAAPFAEMNQLQQPALVSAGGGASGSMQ